MEPHDGSVQEFTLTICGEPEAESVAENSSPGWESCLRGTKKSRSRRVGCAAAKLWHGAYPSVSLCDREHLVYVDGATAPKTGRTGAGAAIFGSRLEGGRKLIRKRLGRGTNQTAELWAIKVGLDEVPGEAGDRVFVFTDSQYAIGMVALGWMAAKNEEIILAVQKTISGMMESGVDITLYWVPGHRGIYGNELADRLATEAL